MREISTRYVPRRPTRHRVRLACQVVRERDFSLLADQMLELSEFGMLVLPKMRILTGESVIVSFMAPFTRTFVDVEATVARVMHGRRRGDMGLGVGLDLSGMTEGARALVREQLIHLPTSSPKRRGLN